MLTFSHDQAFDIGKLRHQDDIEAARIRRLAKRPRRGTVINSVKLVLTAIFAIF